MAERNEKQRYVEPALTRQQRLADVTEGIVVVTGSAAAGAPTPTP
jgi:hypothetical protein